MGNFLSRFEGRPVENYSLASVFIKVGSGHIVLGLFQDLAVDEEIH